MILLGSIAVAFMSGLFARRKQGAEVEVTLSGEARKWATQFEESANRRIAEAERRVQVAEERADEAKTEAENCGRRLRLLEQHVYGMERMLRQNGIEPPTYPQI